MPITDDLARSEPERACLERLRALTGEVDGPMERHCARTHLIALRLADRSGLEVDPELLLCAALLHDGGVYRRPSSPGLPYIADSRFLLEEVLAPFGWPRSRVVRCGDAAEYHHAAAPQWRRGAEVELLRRADLVEVTAGLLAFGVSRRWISELRRRVPAAGMYRVVLRLGVRHRRERPGTLLRIFRPS